MLSTQTTLLGIELSRDVHSLLDNLVTPTPIGIVGPTPKVKVCCLHLLGANITTFRNRGAERCAQREAGHQDSGIRCSVKPKWEIRPRIRTADGPMEKLGTACRCRLLSPNRAGWHRGQRGAGWLVGEEGQSCTAHPAVNAGSPVSDLV